MAKKPIPRSKRATRKSREQKKGVYVVLWCYITMLGSGARTLGRIHQIFHSKKAAKDALLAKDPSGGGKWKLIGNDYYENEAETECIWIEHHHVEE